MTRDGHPLDTDQDQDFSLVCARGIWEEAGAVQPFHHLADVCNGGVPHLKAVCPHVCDQAFS